MLDRRTCGARRLCHVTCVFAVIAFLAASPLQASDIIRIEEDWELVVKEPDVDTQAPQVTCVISPTGDIDSHYAALTVNHKTLPSYDAGGIQLQVWHGGDAVASSKYPQDDLLGTAGETITWTHRMSVDNGQLVFEIVSGQSTTWGSFGGQGNLRTSVDTSLGNLNAYDWHVSGANSSVGYAGNRVTGLVLKRVRAYSAEGLVQEDNSAKTVHPHD